MTIKEMRTIISANVLIINRIQIIESKPIRTEHNEHSG